MEKKSLFTSKTIIGILIAGAGVFGIGEYLPDDTAAKLEETLNTVISTGGLLLAAYGRFKAEKAITVTGK